MKLPLFQIVDSSLTYILPHILWNCIPLEIIPHILCNCIPLEIIPHVTGDGT
jgi:hypothetical protein